MSKDDKPAETPKSADKRPEPEKVKAPPRRAPADWCARIGADRAKHAAADVIHGWTEHQHAEAAPLKLTEDDYREALNCRGSRTPHLPALSPHVAPRRLSGDALSAFQASRSN